jgi:hypothetical protein
MKESNLLVPLQRRAHYQYANGQLKWCPVMIVIMNAFKVFRRRTLYWKWCPTEESNSHLLGRNQRSYPLNEQGILKVVREVGLEPTSLAATASKTAVYTIPPFALWLPPLRTNQHSPSWRRKSLLDETGIKSGPRPGICTQLAAFTEQVLNYIG